MTEKVRCGWCKNDPVYMDYHDREWGKTVKDDRTMFEFIVLESAQAGLSWITILKRRACYEKAFKGFDVDKVAKMTEKDVERLMNADTGIIRNRLKIAGTVKNAKAFKEIQREFGSFYAYLMTFFPNGRPIVNHPKELKDIPARTEVSDAIAKNMKKRGFTFFGSVICYAHLQATGLVDDHIVGCWAKEKRK